MTRANGEPPRFATIAFMSSGTPDADAALARLSARYGNADPDRADVLVALGGDGLMLQVLHRFMGSGKPIYGMNRGSVGFLMNEFSEHRLEERLAAAESSMVHPLVMTATSKTGEVATARAINEVSLLRQSSKVAKVSISIDGRERLS
jgi:NAD+ kinase